MPIKFIHQISNNQSKQTENLYHILETQELLSFLTLINHISTLQKTSRLVGWISLSLQVIRLFLVVQNFKWRENYYTKIEFFFWGVFNSTEFIKWLRNWDKTTAWGLKVSFSLFIVLKSGLPLNQKYDMVVLAYTCLVIKVEKSIRFAIWNNI